MGRRARIRFPGLPLHIVQRGNNRGPCFMTESDRLVYLSLLEERAAQFGCAVHAYVLMSNHAHLLLTSASADGASLLMKHLGQEYVQYVNRAHRRTGSLWEGRFRSSVVDEQGYLLNCYRYIELNPVRAGMAQSPGAYPWSSFAANARGSASTLIVPHAAYLALGPSPSERCEAYARLFGNVLSDLQVNEIRDAVNGGFVLGGDAFMERLSQLSGRPVARVRLNPKVLGSRRRRSGLGGLSPNDYGRNVEIQVRSSERSTR